MFKVIMHKNAMDVAFDVMRIIEYRPGEHNVKGQWINLGYTGNPYRLYSGHTTIRIPKHKWDNWEDITDWLNIKRNTSGRPKCHSCGSTKTPIQKINNTICFECRIVL